MCNHSAVDIAGRAAMSVGAGGQSDVLVAGVYDVWGDADAFIKVGAVANDVTAGTGYKVPAGQIITVRVARNGDRIGSTAAIKIHQVA